MLLCVLDTFRHVQDPGLLNTCEAFPYSLIPSCSNLRVLSACFNSVQVHRTGGGGNLHEVPFYFCRRCRDEGQGIHSQPKPASQLDINTDRGRPFFSCQTELLVCRMSTGAHSASFNSLLRLAYDSLYYIHSNHVFLTSENQYTVITVLYIHEIVLKSVAGAVRACTGKELNI